MFNKHVRVTDRTSGKLLVDWVETGPISIDVVQSGERAFVTRSFFGIELESHLITHDDRIETRHGPGCGCWVLLLIGLILIVIFCSQVSIFGF